MQSNFAKDDIVPKSRDSLCDLIKIHSPGSLTRTLAWQQTPPAGTPLPGQPLFVSHPLSMIIDFLVKSRSMNGKSKKTTH